jgi:phosphopantothenoylcysteine decarboxylase / phosphopantothenate---cysteine ligase
MGEGKNILLGLSGGIAAYKAAELCRLLVKGGSGVKVVMTRNACAFITPLTMQTLSGSKVYTDTFANEDYTIDHISLARWAHLMVVAPATANIIAKLAHGIADDLLSTVFLARGGIPVLLAPAMNSEMYEDQILQRNLADLRSRGVHLVTPGTGSLACGTHGPGRMAEPADIMKALQEILAGRRDMLGLTLLVTAGPTREPIDPVRYLSNYSSGKMGFALARAGRDRGARVFLVAGPTALTVPGGIHYQRVETASQMQEAVLKLAPEMDIMIKAAAVADYRPKQPSQHKIKKKAAALSLPLERNPDILKILGAEKKEGQILVGFAAETRDLAANATLKLKEKNLDLIAANDVSRPDIGFDSDDNALELFFPDGRREAIPLGSKEQVAHALLDVILKIKSSGAMAD